MVSCFLFPEGTSLPHLLSSPGLCVAEGKYERSKDEPDLDAISQGVAIATTFGLIQSQTHSSWRTYPMVWIGKEYAMVIFYDTRHDILMISDRISWGSREAFALIWSALNYSLLPTPELSQYEEYKCGLMSEFEKYQDNFKQIYTFRSSAVCRDILRPKLPGVKSP